MNCSCGNEVKVIEEKHKGELTGHICVHCTCGKSFCLFNVNKKQFMDDYKRWVKKFT